MGFNISKKAQEKIEEYKQTEKGFTVRGITASKDKILSDKERIAKVLNHTGAIIEDLTDE